MNQLYSDFSKKKIFEVEKGKVDWCQNKKTGYPLPFDMAIHPLKIFVEVDGLQHYRQQDYFKVSLAFVQERDALCDPRGSSRSSEEQRKLEK